MKLLNTPYYCNSTYTFLQLVAKNVQTDIIKYVIEHYFPFIMGGPECIFILEAALDHNSFNCAIYIISILGEKHFYRFIIYCYWNNNQKAKYTKLQKKKATQQ